VPIAPDLEAGNMVAKSLSLLAQAEAAGIVLGVRVPIILSGRADSLVSHLASCAVAVLVAAAQVCRPRQFPEGILNGRRHSPPVLAGQKASVFGVANDESMAIFGANRTSRTTDARCIIRQYPRSALHAQIRFLTLQLLD
jgi:hypothetical protein